MKKIINILLMIVFAIITTLNLDARTMMPKAAPAQTKQHIKQDTKALEKELDKVNKAKTIAEKEIAQKNAYQLAQNLLVDLTEERSLMSDIYSGYTLKQIQNARLALAKLYPMQKKVAGALAKKESELAKVTNKGWIWNTALAGQEKEYDTLFLDVTKLTNALARIDRAIRNQKVIAGEEWSNAFRTLITAGVIGTTAVAIDVILYGGAGTTAAASKASALAGSVGSRAAAAGNWIKESGLTSWEWAKWITQYGFTAANTLFGLYRYYRSAESVYHMAEEAYAQLSPEERITAQTELEEKRNKYEKAKKNYETELAKLEDKKTKKAQ